MSQILKDYHMNPQTLHVGCEEPTAYLMPYPTDALALKDKRGQSSFFQSLCGDWKFRWLPSLSELGGVGALATCEIGEETLSVPMSWQMAIEKNYDTPDYINQWL